MVDQILNDILKKEGFYEKIFQSFSALTGIKSTAVKGWWPGLWWGSGDKNLLKRWCYECLLDKTALWGLG